MRKITLNTVNAFVSHSNFSQANTVVSGGHVYLHGNLIARKLNNTQIQINFCHWVTSTTADRINAIVSYCTNDKIKVGIKQGEPELRYADGTKQNVNSGDWVTIDTLYMDC